MNTQKAIQVIDAVSDGINSKKINLPFLKKVLYGKIVQELYNHVLDKFQSKQGDFFDFYLNASDDVKRYILEELGIDVEQDKFPDYDSRIIQLCGGKKRFDVFPFEEEILFQYILFGYNNSLEILKEVSPSAWGTVIENKIDRYGCCQNWTKFWCKAVPEDKGKLIEYIIETYCK